MGNAFYHNFSGVATENKFQRSFGDDDPDQATARIAITRTHATLFLEQGIKEYLQWFPGKDNTVADALLQDFDRSDSELTSILRSSVPLAASPAFSDSTASQRNQLVVPSLLLKLPVKEQLREEHTKTDLGHGNASDVLFSWLTYFST